MPTRAAHESVEQRVREAVSGLDATLAADATIARSAFDETQLNAALPVLSIDLSVAQGGSGSGAAAGGAPPDLQLIGLLGAGGMGAVYAARQRALDRDVALKRPLSADAPPNVRAALLGEARIMGSLEHPNIVPVHALGCDHAGLPVLVMKRIEGVSWRDLLADAAHPMWDRVAGAHGRGLAFHVEVLVQVANALAFAHSRGVVHRDVKPENVMIGAFGEVYLLDWGIARRVDDAAAKQIVGTPAYMAPEMLVDPASADARTDVYLLGASLFEVLVGRPPHEGANLDQVFTAMLLREPPVYPDGTPSDLAALCDASMQADPAVRPQSVAAFRDALASYRAHRASHDLAVSARVKLDAVARQLETGQVELAGVDAGVLLAEARFGFEQSLRLWEGNADGRAGLGRVLGWSIERELGLRNVVAARALLASLLEPRPDLVARVEQLERELEAARAREHANTARARERDATVSAVPRMLFLAGLMVVGGTASVLLYLEERRTGAPPSIEEQLALDGTVLGFLLVGVLLGRRRLMTNEYNRVLWFLWIVVASCGLAMDAFLGSVGVDTYTATTVDFLMFAGMFAVAALAYERFLGWVALCMGAAAAVAAVEPTLSTPAATMALIFGIGFVIERTRRVAVGAESTSGSVANPPT